MSAAPTPARTRAPLGNVPVLVLVAALIALALVCGAGPLTKSGVVSWQLALTVVKWGFFLGAAAAVAAAIVLLFQAFPKYRHRPWVAIAALALALVAVAPPLILLSRA